VAEQDVWCLSKRTSDLVDMALQEEEAITSSSHIRLISCNEALQSGRELVLLYAASFVQISEFKIWHDGLLSVSKQLLSIEALDLLNLI